VRLDTSAFLAVLLASTGSTQADAAALFQVNSRTVRRWLEGTRPTPKVVIERLRALAEALDRTAQAITMNLGVPALLLLYRRDRDVPPWTGLRTAGCHLALVRRVFERRPVYDTCLLLNNCSGHPVDHFMSLPTWAPSR
jgi:transcriptional regulator with XRE-family HTH domain